MNGLLSNRIDQLTEQVLTSQAASMAHFVALIAIIGALPDPRLAKERFDTLSAADLQPHPSKAYTDALELNFQNLRNIFSTNAAGNAPE